MLEWYSLTRRFSVLRNAAGTPIGVYDLKNKFAEQRARGSQNHISEEEEDMILEALGRIHARTRWKTSAGGSEEGKDSVSGNGPAAYSVNEDHHEEGEGSRISSSPSFAGSQSAQSNGTTSISSALHNSVSITSISSGRGSQYSRRFSNNLFGSGKSRDHSYIRGQRRVGDGSRSSTVTHSESTTSMNTVTTDRMPKNTSVYSEDPSFRPVTPDGTTTSPGSSAPASPNQVQSLANDTSESLVETANLDSKLARTLPPERLKRASLALEQVIRELEEEGDDEIVMERSPIVRVPNVASRSLVCTAISSGCRSLNSLIFPG